MTTTRRDFVGKLASAAAIAAVGVSARPSLVSALNAHPRAGDPLLRELAAKAMDAARAAGATYADIRFTLTRSEQIWYASRDMWGVDEDLEHAAVGIRSLTDGAWGFA